LHVGNGDEPQGLDPHVITGVPGGKAPSRATIFVN
jgi:hypothetical protein